MDFVHLAAKSVGLIHIHAAIMFASYIAKDKSE